MTTTGREPKSGCAPERGYHKDRRRRAPAALSLGRNTSSLALPYNADWQGCAAVALRTGTRP
jgi:hypothetical protein